MKAFEMKEALDFIIPAVGNNKARKSLMNIHVDVRNHGVVFTAMDGYLVKQVQTSVFGIGTKEGCFLMDLEAAKRILREVKVKKNENLDVTFTGNTIQIYDVDNLVQDVILRPEGEVESFPIHVMESLGEEKASDSEVAFVPEFMTKIMKGFKFPKMVTTGPSKPMKFVDLEGLRKIAYLMPKTSKTPDNDNYGAKL